MTRRTIEEARKTNISLEELRRRSDQKFYSLMIPTAVVFLILVAALVAALIPKLFS